MMHRHDDDRRVAVIGSGPTGAMAAHELVHNGVAVSLLESGDKFQEGFLLRLMGRNILRRTPPLQNDRRHVVSGDPATMWYANLAPGGLSCQWTGAVPRFAPEDFTEGERLHPRFRWPITYDDVAPYYERVERLMNVTADPKGAPNLPAGYAAFPHVIPDDWNAVRKVAKLHGQGLTVMPLADGPPNLIARRATAFNSYSAIVRPLLRSPNFKLITGAHVLKLEWDGAKKRVTSVVYNDSKTGQTRRLAVSAAVVACGALSSTKLLFDSACNDFPMGLGNTEGVLGQFLHDHPREWWSFEIDKPMSLLAPAAYLTRLPHASSKPLMANSWTLGVVTTGDKIRSRFGGKAKSVGVQVFGTMIPKESHNVKPSDKIRDAFGLPGLDICIKYEPEVIDNMVQARAHLMSLMKDAGYQAQIGAIAPQLFPGSSVHYGGTIRMHEQRQHGMLDAWNRLHEAPNVLVCDASCFTTGSEKNPTLTAMALASRAAERLARDLKMTLRAGSRAES